MMFGRSSFRNMVGSTHRSAPRAPPHLEKLKSAYYRKYATGETGFTLSMVASGSNLNEKLKGLEVHIVEHVGDSDDGDSGGTPNQVEPIAPAESRSPVNIVSCARKRKSAEGMSSDDKRQCWVIGRIGMK
uniref:Uncharacterized protein n=1 Tax=Opuntia streptacantha TaxID=393608 RepID=A0A7C9CJT8_OPUST